VSDADGFARYLAVWNGEAPLAELDAILAPGYRGHLGSQDRDAAGLADAIAAYHARLPDVRFAIVHQFSDGEHVASRVRATASNPESGEPANLAGINISRWTDGRLAEEWAAWETLG